MMGPLSSLLYAATYTLGLAYPAYVTVNAIESPGTQDDTQWLIYWLIFSLVQLVEAVLWPVLKWLGGLYYLLKAAALAWLVLPQTKGATWVYEQIVSPTLKQVGQEARKVPAVQKALEKLDAFTAGKPVVKGNTAGAKMNNMGNQMGNKMNQMGNQMRGEMGGNQMGGGQMGGQMGGGQMGGNMGNTGKLE